YMGVMIDDLISRGTSEPYRMFTSRAEYRLQLREDNADLRLTEKGRELGLVDDVQWRFFEEKREAIVNLQGKLAKKWIRAESDEAGLVEQIWGKKLAKEASLMELLRRPEVDVENLLRFSDEVDIDEKVAEQVAIQAKYAGYIDRQQTEINRAHRYEHLKLPDNVDYSLVSGLSNEVSEKLKKQRPETLGQASRIPGITPAAVALLLVHLKKKSA
ncbi:MAG: tRNA uridine-5-carboxymethylaminomethyl(34) synthesis enzyme MnmG, partial [Pseudomonadota bacterium]